MKNLKKLIFSSFAALTIVFCISICASAQIESLSMVDNDLYASVADKNSRLFVAGYNEGLLVDAFFADSNDNCDIEIVDKFQGCFEYKLFLWDRDSLAPISATYILKDGRAYAEGAAEPVPEYEFSGYTFNQEDAVMIVSSISQEKITGYKAGIEQTYSLTDNVTVLGLSDNFADVVPGSVVLIGTNRLGKCSAIELLAAIGNEKTLVDEEVFKSSFGVYNPSDGSSKYQNFVNKMYSKLGTRINIYQLDEEGNVLLSNGSALTTQYKFSSGSIMCYRVGIAVSEGTPVITVTSSNVSATGDNSVFEGTDTHINYVYLRYDTEAQKITQCVVYCVPNEFDFNTPDPDDPYSPIFGLEPIVILK